MSVTQIVPLGVGSAVPVRGRGFSCVALVRPEAILLFDCGEGTQQRLLEARLKMNKVRHVLVTHLHGDHFFGLPGLLATMSLLGREEAITVVGPPGLRDMIEQMPGLAPGEATFEIRFHELPLVERNLLVVDERQYRVVARELHHGVPAFGYRYQERDVPGRLDVEKARRLGVTDHSHYRLLKAGEEVELAGGRRVKPSEVVGPGRRGGSFAYVTDTRPCPSAVDLARDVDILYHEATFSDDLQDRAEATGHSTTVEAAGVARKANAGRLLLAHFSARYRDIDPLVEEARTVFADTEAAEELQRYSLRTDKLITHRIE